MAGFMDILGAMVQQGMSQSSSSRMANAMGAGKSGGSLDDIMGTLGQMLGNGQSGQVAQSRQAPQAGSDGLGEMFGDVLGGLGNKKAVLGGLGALAGALLGGGKSSAREAVGGGSLAMLASLAFSALKKVSQAPQQTPRALLEPQTPQEEQALEQDAEIIVKAMINAAKADGRIDETEVQKIVGKLEEDGLTQEEKELFVSEANKPMNIDAVVISASGHPDLAAQIYAASLLAIEIDTKAERQYIQKLAVELGLHPQVTAHIEQALGINFV